ncbi:MULTISPECIES: disulfide oxidoreductase [unclassified Paenibacillus]|nr:MULTISPECIES: disulfide oxidoreductase [unclassified Paenibacillus]MCM3127089.1 disulfide oxidoreductase [Paenibacillus sp. MER 78]SFS56092.1 disulfide bond formation protein DsbB [Paenibacillus sp. 453mf]
MKIPIKSEHRLYGAWIVSMAATFGSLYFSEIKGYTPCDLCWYQRIFMYPLTIILAIACYNKDRSITRYVLPLSWIGGCISLFHILYQRFHTFFEDNSIVACGPTPCASNYFVWFGFITIPVLAFTAFILIILLLWKLPQIEEE